MHGPKARPGARHMELPCAGTPARVRAGTACGGRGDAAAEVKSSRRRSGLEINSSTGATTLINHALMSGDPRAAALLRQPEPPAREPPELEAEP
jgi:hypothetical protein